MTFDALTASSMYTWHWEEEFWKAVSIEYPFDPTAKRYFDPVLALQSLLLHNASLIAEKQELIRSRVFELQYSLDGRFETTEGGNALRTRDGFGPRIDSKIAKGGDSVHANWPLDGSGQPMRDAYDLIMDHVLGWHSGVEADIRNGTVPECWNGYLDPVENKCKPHPEGETASPSSKGTAAVT